MFYNKYLFLINYYIELFNFKNYFNKKISSIAGRDIELEYLHSEKILDWEKIRFNLYNLMRENEFQKIYHNFAASIIPKFQILIIINI
jgi:hypothetical protein